MTVQQYLIHLTNGDRVLVSEPYDLTGPDTLIGTYQRGGPDTLFCIGDSLEGFHYFKGKDIVQICTADVREIGAADWNHFRTARKATGGKTVNFAGRKECRRGQN